MLHLFTLPANMMAACLHKFAIMHDVIITAGQLMAVVMTYMSSDANAAPWYGCAYAHYVVQAGTPHRPKHAARC